VIPKQIIFKYIKGWQYNIVQIAKNKFCVEKTNRKEKIGRNGETIKGGLRYTLKYFKTFEKAEKYLEEEKKK